MDFCVNGQLKLQGKNKIVGHDELLNLLSQAYKVKDVLDVVVFGSYARGEEKSGISDVDVVVIMNDSRSSYQLMKEFLDLEVMIAEEKNLMVHFLAFNQDRYNDPIHYALALNIWKDGVRIAK